MPPTQEEQQAERLWWIASIIVALLMCRFTGGGFLPAHAFDFGWWAMFAIIVIVVRFAFALGILVAIAGLVMLVLGVGC